MKTILLILVLGLFLGCESQDSGPFIFSKVSELPKDRQALEFRDSDGTFVKELIFQNRSDTLKKADSSNLLHNVRHDVQTADSRAAYGVLETKLWSPSVFEYPSQDQYVSIHSRYVLLDKNGKELWTYEYKSQADTLIDAKNRWLGSLKFSKREGLLIFSAMTGEGKDDGFVKLINSRGVEIVSVSEINNRPITLPGGIQIGWDGRFCVIHSIIDRINSPYPTDVLFIDLETLAMKSWPEPVRQAIIHKDGNVDIYLLEADRVECVNLYDFFTL